MSTQYVCIVSDVPDSADSLTMLLSVYGHRTRVFSSVDELEAAPEFSNMCAVVSSFKEGGAPDRELAKRLCERAPLTPIYFIANGIFTRAALLAAPENVAGIFDSPYEPEELAAAIRATCTCEIVT